MALTKNDTLESACNRIRAALEKKRRQLYEEIRTYPRPVPACDQQFNYLLEQRARIEQELTVMEQTCAQSLGPGSIELIEKFLAESNCVDDETKKSIRFAIADSRRTHAGGA